MMKNLRMLLGTNEKSHEDSIKMIQTAQQMSSVGFEAESLDNVIAERTRTPNGGSGTKEF